MADSKHCLSLKHLPRMSALDWITTSTAEPLLNDKYG